MSAITNERSALDLHDAQVGILGGERVVGDLRPARDSRLSSVLLPAFGLPIRPTSAMTFSSRMSSRDSGFAAGGELARRAIGRAFEAQVAFAAAAAAGRDDAIAGTRQILEHVMPAVASMISVPGGTWITRSSPLRPWQFELPPRSPFSACQCFVARVRPGCRRRGWPR